MIQAAEDANIVLLRRSDDHDGDHVIIENNPVAIRGWRVDQVLTSDLFGLESSRPPRITELMDKRTALLAKGLTTEEDRAELAKIDAELDSLPGGETREQREMLAKIANVAELLRKHVEERQ